MISSGVKLSQAIRGNDISMIFQDPLSSLNPVYTIGYQIAEAIVLPHLLQVIDFRDFFVTSISSNSFIEIAIFAPFFLTYGPYDMEVTDRLQG